MSQAPCHKTVQSVAPKAPSMRRGRALAVALALPTTLASVGLATPAEAAAPAQATTPATSAPAPTASAAGASAAGVSVKSGHYASGVYVVQYGDKGNYVKTVQQRLSIGVDGSFGPGTRGAVKTFQSGKGLAADGIVGPKTWEALGGFPGKSGGGSTEESDTSSTASSSKAVEIAKKYTGTPYNYGGSSPSEGFDCSGLTSYVFNQLGKELPRSARAQQSAVTRVSSPQPGDLVFYGYPAYHVGIYVGGGQMIDAPKPGKSVQVRDVYDPEVSSYGRV